MNLSKSALTTLVGLISASSTTAFTPSASRAARSIASRGLSSVNTAWTRRAASTVSSSCRNVSGGTALKANVLKLTEPAKDFLPNVDVFIFDCDGVIWRGDSVIEGIPETLAKLRSLGKKMYFVTNNSTKSRAGYKKKFDSLGLSDVPAEEIFSSSFAAAAYLEQTKFKDSGKKVYVIGEVGIQEELDLIGVDHFGGPEDGGKKPDMGPGCKLDHDPDVGAVVVGFDRNINYYKIQYAQLCINENPGCEFIATNTDAVTHLTDAQEWAGNGSMVGAIKGCTGKEPTVVGKPSPLMIDYLCEKLGLDRGRICMVGDRLDTDVLFGTDNGLKSVLVLSGVTTEEKLLSQENTITPDFYADSIVDFFVDETAAVEAKA
eukprot:CAMPEP_0171343036 /NCGR_PEP_ID=MMETSP0878-20121228/16101_1 /TAXON_ID=67004 /ORGANISM="Thalassiosira weissflogii, Strain CCMP1336" /LENGTH=374 /DNA_ID=CAMNT_0011845885 /DNA_START=47 /DNA_END=1171 /DNA_ORIENTATION=+